MEYSLEELKAEQEKRQVSKIIDRCKIDPVYFINNFAKTVDPRGVKESVPFKLFDYQEELIRVLHKSLTDSMSGNLTKKTVAIDKSRDMGATWCVVSFHTWAWLFLDGFNALWGGKVEER